MLSAAGPRESSVQTREPHRRPRHRKSGLVARSALALLATFSTAIAQSEAPATPPVTTGAREVVSGGTLCLCVDAPEDARDVRVTVGRRPAEIVSRSAGRLDVSPPEGLEPGSHIARVAIAGIDGEALEHSFTLLRVEASIDSDRLRRLEATEMRLAVQGTRQARRFRVVNRSPSIVSVAGGVDQIVTTSGGRDNVVELRVQGLARGDFQVDYELLDAPPCPCEGTPLAISERDAADDSIASQPAEPTRSEAPADPPERAPLPEEPATPPAEGAPSDPPPRSGAAPGDRTTSSTPPGPIVADAGLAPPAEPDGPCDWVRVRFQILLDGFPLPDIDGLCGKAAACVEAVRAKQVADDARAARDAAKRAKERIERQKARFDDYLRSDAARRNTAGDPGLAEHYRNVQADDAQALADAHSALAEAEQALADADAEAARSAAACAAANAAIEAELARLRALLEAWEPFQLDLARCVECESIEILDGKIRDVLERLRRERAACEDALAGAERDALERARAASDAADAEAGENAAELDAQRAACRDIGAQVHAAYQECYERALEGLDFVEGESERGYRTRRRVDTGGGGPELGPPFFRTVTDARRFRRAMDDCVRNRRDGRVTKPNALTLRRDLSRCERKERAAANRARRSAAKAADAARAEADAQERLDAVLDALRGAYDGIEAALAAWLDHNGVTAEKCEFRRKECDRVRAEGEAANAAIPAPCSAAAVLERGESAGARARDALARMGRLTRIACGGGRADGHRAANGADSVTKDDGLADQLAEAEARRKEALEEARRLLAEGRCEEAAAAFHRAAAAAREAVELCARASGALDAAERATAAAESSATTCEEDEARILAEEEARRQEQERREAERARRGAEDAERARRQARAQAEADAAKARACEATFDAIAREYELYDEARELLEDLHDRASKALDVAGSIGQGAGEAAGATAKGASTRAAGASGVAAGALSLGATVFYWWMQAELTDAVERIGRGHERELLRAQLLFENAGDGECGRITSRGVTYLWFKVGGHYRVFRFSHSRGVEFLGDLEVGR